MGQSQYDIIADEIDIKVHSTEAEGQPQTYAAAVAANPGDDDEDDSTAVQEDVDVEETIILEKKSPSLWKTLLTGLPSPTSRFLSDRKSVV